MGKLFFVAYIAGKMVSADLIAPATPQAADGCMAKAAEYTRLMKLLSGGESPRDYKFQCEYHQNEPAVEPR